MTAVEAIPTRRKDILAAVTIAVPNSVIRRLSGDIAIRGYEKGELERDCKREERERISYKTPLLRTEEIGRAHV